MLNEQSAAAATSGPCGPEASSNPGAVRDGVDAGASPAPLGIAEASRKLVDEGGEAAREALKTASALRSLVAAELALARTALVRAGVLLVAAVIAALVAVFFVFATLSALLLWLGLNLPSALAVSTVLLLLMAGMCALRAKSVLRLTRFEGTRRQIARLMENSP